MSLIMPIDFDVPPDTPQRVFEGAEHARGAIGSMYFRPNGPHPRGFVNPGHYHVIDHILWLVYGELKIEWYDRSTNEVGVDIVKGWGIKYEMKANRAHRITIVSEEAFWECVFSQAEAEAQGVLDDGDANPPRFTRMKDESDG